MSRIWQMYQNALKKHPLRTAAISTSKFAHAGPPAIAFLFFASKISTLTMVADSGKFAFSSIIGDAWSGTERLL